MSARNKVINWLLLFISFSTSLLIAEGISRLVFNPLDILSPELTEDNILGHHIMPFSGGHDEWGFRNYQVPDSVDIAILGDSQTWGLNAPTEKSFPWQLGELTNKRVYNFGVSGYGPVQYLSLLRQKAVSLKPSVIIVGLYLGNDFDDAYRLAYQYKYWKDLRSPDFERKYNSVDFKNYTTDLGRLYGMRYWLNHHSIFYRFFKSKVEFLRNVFFKDEDGIRYVNEAAGIDKCFNPASRLFSINCYDPKIAEGFRVSLACIVQMQKICHERNIKMLVAIIPTDISVYADYLKGNKSLKEYALFDSVISSEQKLKALTILKFEIDKIDYVDVTDSLRNHNAEAIYPQFNDDHPTSLGYTQIAKAIKVRLKSIDY